MFRFEQVVYIVFACCCISDVTAAETAVGSSCVRLQTTRITNYSETEEHQCFLCSDVSTKSHFCDNVNKSYESWFKGWTLQENHIDAECLRGRNFAKHHQAVVNNTHTNISDESQTSCCRSDCKNVVPVAVQSPAKSCCKTCNLTCCKSKDARDCGDFDGIADYLPYIFGVGVFGLIGNVVIIVVTSRLLKQKYASLSKVQLAHNMVILNLAISDSLMGVYLCALGSQIVRRQTSGNGYDWRGTSLCSVLGIMNFISSQVSVTLLVIMTSFRLQSTLRPYKRLSARTIVACVLTCWISWLLISFIPLINTDSLKLIFVKRIKMEVVTCGNSTDVENEWVSYQSLKKTVSCVLAAANETCSKRFVLSEKPHWNQLIRLSQQLNIYGSETMTDFYNGRSWCSMDYLIKINDQPAYFTLAILSYNFMAFLFVAMVHVYILLSTADYKHCHFHRISAQCRQLCSVSGSGSSNAPSCGRESENKKLHRLIIAIIVTDFCCWVPVCLIAFVYVGSGEQVDKNPSLCWHHISRILALHLVPINSFINPFLHSGKLRKYFKKFVFKRLRSSPGEINI